MDKRLPETKFCVETLFPQGLCILGGSPKVGKSWLVLDLCIHIAKGEPMWGLPVTQGETLYLCLEDSERRIQERLNTITDDVPPGLYFATGSTSIESGVCDWIRKFKHEHPAVTFVAIDTFQLIRTPTSGCLLRQRLYRTATAPCFGRGTEDLSSTGASPAQDGR